LRHRFSVAKRPGKCFFLVAIGDLDEALIVVVAQLRQAEQRARALIEVANALRTRNTLTAIRVKLYDVIVIGRPSHNRAGNHARRKVVAFQKFLKRCCKVIIVHQVSPRFLDINQPTNTCMV
jgi:hypothetical protein